MVIRSHASHYEVLALEPGATPEQVEKAYHFFTAMYEDTAVATYSLLEPEEQRHARDRVRQAYEVLRDPLQRQQYDASLEAATASTPAPQVAETPAPRGPRAVFRPSAPKAPVPLARTLMAAPPPPAGAAPLRPRVLPEPVTGESLRKAREERGVSLQDIAAATKIGVRFLEYIEGDRHADLPAVVYLRGFVQQYAHHLGLDSRRTADSYLIRVVPRG
jgi:curved DNA-binding protein CbpA